MATPLDIGQSRTATIRAEEKWNDTGIQLRPGRYRFEARGTWADWLVRCGPEGFHSLLFLLFEQQRRVPRASWFALVGSVGHDEAKAFVLGKEAEIDIETEGQLCCFANDVAAMYWNNNGAVELTVTCLSLKGAAAKPTAAEKPAAAAPVAKAEPAPKPAEAPKPAAPKKAPAKKAAAPAKKPEGEKKPKPAKKEAPAKKAATPKAAEAAPTPKPKAAAKKPATGSAAAPGKAKAAPRAKPGKTPAP